MQQDQPKQDVEKQEAEVVKEQPEAPEKQPKGWQYWILRVIIIVCLVIALILVIVFIDEVKIVMTKFLEWLRDNPVIGPVILTCLYILATVFFVPGSLLTIGGAVALQQAYRRTWLAVLVGTASVWTGAWIGANCAMLLGRYLFRDQAKKLADKYAIIGALDKAMETEGLKFVFLLRLCPLVPYNAFNYTMGITGVKFQDYAIGGFGMIPGTVVYVFLGTTISNIADAASGNYEQGTASLIFIIVGTALAFAAIVYITVVVRKYLNLALESEKVEPEGEKQPEQNKEEKV